MTWNAWSFEPLTFSPNAPSQSATKLTFCAPAWTLFTGFSYKPML
jgi:hypothetical protein